VTWYVSDLARFRAEREGLEVFALSVDWFVTIGWRIDDSLRLVLDADIAAGGRVYPVFLQYPHLFPHTPPSVFPRGDTSRWSQHQFGPGGELCLEYGPDNWMPDFTGTQLIESAHRLLEGENPGSGEKGTVPSRHSVSLGQKLRSEYSRILITRNLEAFFASVPARAPLVGDLVSAHHKEGVVHIIDKVTHVDGTRWIDQSVPKHLAEEFWERPVTIFRIEPGTPLPPTSSLQDFRSASAALGLNPEHRYAIILRGSEVHTYCLWEKDNTVAEIAVVPAQPAAQRLDASHGILKGKHVALIGCGSLGSKVGVILARSGSGRFLLVDDDILLPDNFVRNDLDWRDVGTHKAHAVARRMQLVNPDVETKVWRARLAGQESSEFAETILKMIGNCDLIFDATANPDILNLVSAVAVFASKPVMWAEVFGGGIGGLIARCRPGHEPPPQHMRRAIENWFSERGPPPIRSTRSYEAGQQGVPLIADDADVSAIAAHAARLAIDTLIGRDPSLFPNSVYAIGLGVGSIFTQPFETFPIQVGRALVAASQEQLTAEEAAVEVAKIVDLIKARKDETAVAADNSQTPPA
jgi:sulfur-carrier protein adenylyltransferase/sulfurtransferase